MTHPEGGSGTGPGRIIAPLTAEQRAENYRRQAGGPHRLTARQQRRIRHKANRALVGA